MISKIQRKAQDLLPQLIQFRRHLHAHPELSFQEFETANFIEMQLKRIGIKDVNRIANTGVVALIQGKNPHKKCVALRADMDALPILEKNETAYASKNPSVMHACGHDAHTTCLLGAAEILYALKESFEGTIKCIFQPGEEKSPGGASLLIQEGVLNHPAPSAIFGLHVEPKMKVGTVGFKPGKYMAATDEIHVKIIGKGGHAAMPHLTIDPIVISASIIIALQQVVSRKSNPTFPTVLSFGRIAGGEVNNVIPETVSFSGTLRTFDEEWRAKAKNLIRSTIEHICEIHGATAEIEIPAGYPFLHNDEMLTEDAIKAAEEYLGNSELVKPLEIRMTAEDFSFYAQKIPACFFRLGTNRDHQQFTNPVHTANFDIDENSLAIGSGMMSWQAIQYLMNT